MENGNVNIMFSGHTHLYSRYASADPKRGADTLYVTQGDARIGDGKIDTGKPDQRLNDNYPNLLATGKGDMLEVTVKDGLLTYKNLGLSSDGEKIFETVTLSKDGAQAGVQRYFHHPGHRSVQRHCHGIRKGDQCRQGSGDCLHVCQGQRHRPLAV